MYSVKGDTILDPFLGTGTTISAAIASNRNCFGYEFDETFRTTINKGLANIIDASNKYIVDRLNKHLSFIKNNPDRVIKYKNRYYGFPVVTSPEQEILFNKLKSINFITNDDIEVFYLDRPHGCFNLNEFENFECDSSTTRSMQGSSRIKKVNSNDKQMPIFKGISL